MRNTIVVYVSSDTTNAFFPADRERRRFATVRSGVARFAGIGRALFVHGSTGSRLRGFELFSSGWDAPHHEVDP